MNLGLLMIGLAFLFNPNLNIIDIFPDFIGYILIYYALEKFSDIVEKIGDARKLFWRMFIVTLVKAAAVIPMFASRDDISLVLTFSSGVVELIWLIPAITALFEGFEYAGTRFDGKAAFVKTDSLKYFTVMFFILKSVCSVLPELTSLSMFDTIGDVRANSLNIKDYKPHFIGMCAGIIWLFRMIRYTSGMSRDRLFIENCEAKYNADILPKKELFICRNMKSVSLLVTLGALLSLTFYLDGVNFVPNFLGAVFLIIAFTRLMVYDRARPRIGILLCTGYGVFSVANILLQIKFKEDYGTEAVKWVTEAENMYNLIKAGMIIQQAFFIVAVVLLSSVYMNLIKAHTYLLYPADSAGYKESANRILIKELNLRLNIFGSAGVAAGVLYALHPAVALFFGEIWMISVLTGVIFVIVTFRVMGEVNENLYSAYLQNELSD